MHPDNNDPASCIKPPFIQRTPIFSRNREVYAYLLSMPNQSNSVCDDQSDTPTCHLIHEILQVVDMSCLIDQARMVISIDDAALLRHEYKLMPAAKTILKIDTTRIGRMECIEAIEQAKSLGYTFMLDTCGKELTEVEGIDTFQLICVDANEVKHATIQAMQRWRNTLLVTCHADCQEQAKGLFEMGVPLVGGFFYGNSRPKSHRKLSENQVIKLRFLTELNKEDLDYRRLAEIIKCDVALSYRLLKAVNAVSNGMREHVDSIPHAIAMLGEQHMRTWGAAIALSTICADQPRELLLACLIRARFCEQLTQMCGESNPSSAFMLGLLSLIDKVIGLPMSDAIAQLHLSSHLSKILMGENDCEMAQMLELVISCERGAWGSVHLIGREVGLSPARLAEVYYNTMGWVKSFLQLDV